MRSLTIVILCAVASWGCAPAPSTPTDTVEAYFRNLKRDPVRNLPLLTPQFHDRHGISMLSLKGWLWGEYLFMDPIERKEPIEALAPVDAPRGRDAWEFAWLQVQVEGRLRLAVELLEPQLRAPVPTGEGRVDIEARMPVDGSYGFVQVFHLKQDPGGPWRIDAIEQRGVHLRDALIAFAAYPHAALIPAVTAEARANQQL